MPAAEMGGDAQSMAGFVKFSQFPHEQGCAALHILAIPTRGAGNMNGSLRMLRLSRL